VQQQVGREPGARMQGQQQGFYRVKVYKLNETGGWDDKGTGLASVGPLEVSCELICALWGTLWDARKLHLLLLLVLVATWGRRAADGAVLCLLQTPHQATSSLGLVVLAEDTHKTLLAHRICTDDDIYHRQGELTLQQLDTSRDLNFAALCLVFAAGSRPTDHPAQMTPSSLGPMWTSARTWLSASRRQTAATRSGELASPLLLLLLRTRVVCLGAQQQCCRRPFRRQPPHAPHFDG
jgi:hypothetical protein